MKYLCVTKKVETRIAALRRTGKAGTDLANKAASIIESLAEGAARQPLGATGRFTKYGEKRITNCRKYDLGCGYRLIALKRGETVYVPFLGSHDACQRWLENNSRCKAFKTGKGDTVPIEERNDNTPCPQDSEHVAAGEKVDDVLTYITDKDLRSVFNGLVEGARKGQR
jgi:hypothetical protein